MEINAQSTLHIKNILRSGLFLMCYSLEAALLTMYFTYNLAYIQFVQEMVYEILKNTIECVLFRYAREHNCMGKDRGGWF